MTDTIPIDLCSDDEVFRPPAFRTVNGILVELDSDDEDDVELSNLTVDDGKENQTTNITNTSKNERNREKGGQDRKPAAISRLKVLRTSSNGGLRKVSGTNKKSSEEIDVMEAKLPAERFKMVNAPNDAEEDCMIIGSRGDNASIDYPHSREHCILYPMAQETCDPLKYCRNCFCYICDKSAMECFEWHRHCRARYHDIDSRKEREQRRSDDSLVTSSAGHRRLSLRSGTQFVDDKTRGLIRLANLKKYSISNILLKIKADNTVERVPSIGFAAKLRRCEKQSLAFMCDAENAGYGNVNANLGGANRGGWLCWENRMGKLDGMSKSRRVIIALISTNMPSGTYPAIKEISHQICSAQKALEESRPRRHKRERERDQFVMKLKVTVILTSQSLLGRWEAICSKSAQGLRVKTFDPSRRSDDTNHQRRFKFAADHKEILCDPLYGANQLRNTDVILSPVDAKWPREIIDGFEFHRVVLDEAHLLSMPSDGVRSQVANSFNAKLRWCVTGNPMLSGMRDLLPQKAFLRMQRFPLLGHHDNCEDEETFLKNVNMLKNVMIFHAVSKQRD